MDENLPAILTAMKEQQESVIFAFNSMQQVKPLEKYTAVPVLLP